MTAPFRIAIAGLGTVGGGVVKALANPELAERAGRRLEIVAVSARDRKKDRGFDLSASPGATDAARWPESDADVIVELIGGEDGVALRSSRRALDAGKHVVTGNKALLARHGARLAALAEANGVALKFEAAVAGGIPIVKALRESLIAHGVVAVRGILNGTCNYILTQMEATGRPFAEVLEGCAGAGLCRGRSVARRRRRRHGAQAGAALQPRVRHHADQNNITVEGIERITPDDIRFAREFGFRIKLLGIARRTARASTSACSPPWCAPARRSPTSTGVFNAVMADAGPAGRFFFEGRGAGDAPTAMSVIADLVDIARGNFGPAFGRPAATLNRCRRPIRGCDLGLLPALRGAGRARRAGGNRPPPRRIAAFPSKA